MPIRLSGMISGMDTDSIVKDMVKAYSVKKDNMVKQQTKLTWKQEAWQTLNEKIKKLYTDTLSDMRLSSGYIKKKTTISNSNKATVTGNNAPNGMQSLDIKDLAATGSITGGELVRTVGTGKLAEDSKLSDLGITQNSTISVKVGGQERFVNVAADMSINQFVYALKDAGVEANFDVKNQRIFINAKESGKDNDFSLTAATSSGVDALKAMKLFSASPVDLAEYRKWASYVNDVDNTAPGYDDPTVPGYAKDPTKVYLSDLIDAEYQTKKTTEAAEKTRMEDENTAYAAEEAEWQKKLTNGNDGIAALNTAINAIRDWSTYSAADQAQMTSWEQRIKDLTDACPPGMTEADRQTELTQKKTQLDSLKYGAYTDASGNIQPALSTGDTDKIKGLESELKLMNSSVKTFQDKITGLQTKISDNNAIKNDPTQLTAFVNTKNAATEATIKDRIVGQFSTAVGLVGLGGAGTITGNAHKTAGQDAVIELNGVEFKSNSNTFTVNGLTIDVLEKTDVGSPISISTSTDTQAIYDTIKNFIKGYNELINEFDAKYNAKSAKGYEPLTSEEKDAMTDKEIEDWEKKIKDSLFRRDQTLDSVGTAMKSAMTQSFTINGKKYSLASFGISTGNYLETKDNEKNAFIIEEGSAGKPNKLMSMLTDDPETTIDFFKQLTTGLYDTLDKKWSPLKDVRSKFSVYNDKTMTNDLKEYADNIKAWEKKIKAMEDSYYRKFSAMETALSKMQSSSSALSGMFGTS